MFALADENSKTLKREDAAVAEAQQGVMVANSGYLPDIGISLSASYIGNGYLTDRDFANGQSIKMPHFGNNFAVEATQLIYGGDDAYCKCPTTVPIYLPARTVVSKYV